MIRLLYTYLFDIGGEIRDEDLKDVCSSIGEIKKEKTSEMYTDYFIEVGAVPVRVSLGEENVKMGEVSATLRKFAKISALGAVLLEFLVEIDKKLDFEGIKETAFKDSVQIGGTWQPLRDLAESEYERVSGPLKHRMVKNYTTPFISDEYRIIIDSETRSDREICALLMKEEPKYLSEDMVKVMLRHKASYSVDDRIVFTGTSSYIYSPKTYPEDVINILELAKIQLFELKIYDLLLDASITKSYGIMEAIPDNLGLLSMGVLPTSKEFKRLSILAFDLRELRVDLVDTVTDLMNSTKVTNDPFLAYLYRRVSEEFRINEWYESIKNKLDLIGGVYSMTIDRLNMSRSYTMEFLIFLLILIEAVIFLGLGIL